MMVVKPKKLCVCEREKERVGVNLIEKKKMDLDCWRFGFVLKKETIGVVGSGALKEGERKGA